MEADALDDLPLSRKQLLAIAECERHRISVLSGAVRSGKTIATLWAFLFAVAEAPSSGLIVTVGKSLLTLERNIFDPLQDPALFGEITRHIHHTRGASVATVLGRTVHLIGANDARAEGRLRGMTACLAMVDEATLVPEAFWNQLLARLSVPGARLIATTNPDSSRHWLKVKYLDRADELDIGYWHFRLSDNPSLTEAYVAALKAEYGEGTLWYKRFIDGLWIAADGAVYEMWDDTRHIIRDLPPIARWLAVGVDVGTMNPFHAVLLGLGADGCLYVTAEWRYDGRTARHSMTDAEYSTAVRTWLEGLGVRPEWVVVDPSAASFIEQLHRDGITPAPADNTVLDGIRTVASLLAAGRLKVHASCTGLIDEFPGYAWDEKAADKGEDKPVKADDHGLDALRYALRTTEALWRPYVPLAAAAA